MDAHKIQEIADRISQKLKESGVSPDTQSIFDKLSSYIIDFGVAPFEAERKVLEDQYNQYSVSNEKRGAVQATASVPQDGPKNIASMAEGDWVNFDVKVVSLSQPRSPAISQTGILSDSSGATQFTVFAKATEIPVLEKDKWYHLETATVDSFRGALTLKIHSGTKVTPISEDRVLDSPKPTPLAEIKKAGVVPCVRVKYVDEWEIRSERMMQTGLLADASGRSKFVLWKDDGKEKLKIGSVYTIYYATSEEFNGRFSLGLSSATLVEEDGSEFTTIVTGGQEPKEELPITPIHDLKVGYASLKVKFIEEWEIKSERMMQIGLVGDETGKIKFVIWKDDTKKPLELNRIYHLKNVKVDEYNGRLSLALNRGEYILEDENTELEVGIKLDELSGAIVQVAKGSGVIKRCPVEGCKRVLSKQNLCPVHELQPNFTYDMRIKAVLDDGYKAYNILINREVAERIVGITMDDAIETATTSALGLDDIQMQISDKIVGRYFKCLGSWFNDLFLVKEAEFMKYNKDEAIALLNKTGIKEEGV